MTNNNLRHWERYEDIDPKFTKAITGKPYKGTSPNPQYVIKCLTDIFGPVGEGFGWDVVAEGFVPLNDEILHWCRIRFWHTDRANTFDSYGQTKALMNTRNGMMSDEDAPKKSLTDAITKAASHIGVAANIFLGRWDDQKYVAQVTKDYEGREAAPEMDWFTANLPGMTTPEQINAVLPRAKKAGRDVSALVVARANELGLDFDQTTREYVLVKGDGNAD